MIGGDWPWVTWSSTGAPSLMPYGHSSVLPGSNVSGCHVLNAPGITTNSNSRGQGINRVFKCKDFPAPPGGLNEIWEKGPSLRSQMLIPVLVRLQPVTFLPWTSVSSTRKWSFPNLFSELSWAPMVKVVLQCQANGQVLPWTYWGQRVRLAAAPRGWEWEQPISVERVQNWVPSLDLPLPICSTLSKLSFSSEPHFPQSRNNGSNTPAWLLMRWKRRWSKIST